MMRVAIYSSVLYGEDFIVESIWSILPYVDRVFVVFMKRPWGGTLGVSYKGKWISWPEKFDNTREKIAAMDEPRVTIIDSEKHSPWNRWGHAYDLVRGLYTPLEVLFLDPDCVFSDTEGKTTFREWEEHKEYRWAAPGQVELWRTPAWQIIRPRSMASLHRGDLSVLSFSTEDTRPKTHALAGRIHNFGFCCSESNTRWKHLTALAFSPIIGESLPNPTWFERTWLAWDPVTNNRNLEVSLGCESAISHAAPYETSELPESVKRRYDAGEWPTYRL